MRTVIFAAIVAAPVALAAAQATRLTADQVANYTYEFGDKSTVESGKVPLAKGRWVDPEPEGSTFTLEKQMAFGDLDGDKAGDAAVIVKEDTRGTGKFYHLFILMNRGGSRCRSSRRSGSATGVSSSACASRRGCSA